MRRYEIEGTMTWHGVYTVHADTEEDAKELIRRGEWYDWVPTELSDWEAGDVEDVEELDDVL
jgi:hypothetical protein